MKKLLYLLLAILFLSNINICAQKLSHSSASPATKTLYSKLFQIRNDFTLFGHQDDLAYGVNWKYKENYSDIKSVVNDFPAIYGWDIGKIEHQNSKNLDGVPFEKMREYIKTGYQKGAVITISWHLDNPLTGGNSWDTTKNTVKSILPGSSKFQLYQTWLNRAADFLYSLKDNEGNLIPILFRPFHEENGNWFWWCRNVCTDEDYRTLWHYTINYLRNERKLNNLIIVFNSNDINNEETFLKNYPGDEWVDVLSIDQYQYHIQDKQNFIKNTRKQLKIISKIAEEKQKLTAFAETGFEAIPDAKWWTNTLWPILKDLPISYVLVWRNAGLMPNSKKLHYYAPFRGQKSAKDFKNFYKNKHILFEKRNSTLNLYLNQ